MSDTPMDDKQMRQAFDVWIKMPHETGALTAFRRNGPLERIAVPVEGRLVDDCGRAVTHVLTSSWNVAVWGVAYLAGELEATRKSRTAADDEATRLTIERDAARARAGDLMTELAEARRQVEALVGAVHVNWCPPSVSHCMMPDGDGSDISKCRACWSAWSAQQAKGGRG